MNVYKDVGWILALAEKKIERSKICIKIAILNVLRKY